MSYTISIRPSSPYVEYTGRWHIADECATAVCTGSSFRVGFMGEKALLSFDVSACEQAFPHIYISVDGGAVVENAVSHLIRVYAKGEGAHEIKIIFKSALQTQRRWDDPVAKVAFLGCVDTEGADLAPDTRGTIEFVGDSITEGSSIYYPQLDPIEGARWIDNLVYMNDALSGYAYKTAELLNMRGTFMGFGSTGVSVGAGDVPRGALAYPYIFKDIEYKGCSDIVVINYGANDRDSGAMEFTKGYWELLCAVRKRNPEAVIYAVVPYCKAFSEDLKKLVENFNEEKADSVIYIDTTDWGVPLEPLHPTDATNTMIAEKLSGAIKATYNK